MKLRLTATLLFLCGIAFSQTNYYVSASGNDANSGTSTGSPWKTIQKVNATVFPANSIVNFNGGDVFYGSIIRNTTNIVKIQSYGTGKAIISGATALTTWVKTGTNKYYATLNADSTLNIVTKDGVPQGLARYPNETAAERGYLHFNTVAGFPTTKIRSTIAGSYVGKKMIVRANHWRHEKVIVTADNNDTLTFKYWFSTNIGGSSPMDSLENQFGYFFVDDTSYLDTDKEYKYEKSLSRLYMYFPDDNPAAHTVFAGSVDTLVNMNGTSGLSIYNLSFMYGNQFGVYGGTNDNVNIKKCDVQYMGMYGVSGYRLTHINIDSNYFADVMSDAIYVNTVSINYRGVNTRDNSVFRIGIIPSMICTGQGSEGVGISVKCFDSLNILRNFVSQTGVDGFRWEGGNVYIYGNWSELPCSVGDDHASYYTYYAPGTSTYPYRNRVVSNNFAWYGVGAPNGCPAGSKPLSSGYYNDGQTGWVSYLNNFAGYFPRKLWTFNIDSNITMIGNVGIMGDSTKDANAYAVGVQVWYGATIRNFVCKNNVFYGYQGSTQDMFYYLGSPTSTALNIPTELSAIGTVDSNYYGLSTSSVFWMQYRSGVGGTTKRTFSQWKTATGFDTHGDTIAAYPNANVKVLANWSNTSRGYAFSGTWQDEKRIQYSGSITIPAYTVKILYFVSATTAMSKSHTQVNPTCFDSTNGSATVTITGGVLPIHYLWSPDGETTNVISSKHAGTYYMTATDAVAATISDTITLTQPTQLVGSQSYGVIYDSLSTTTVIISASGGTPGYTGVGSFTQGVGTVSYPITDANGCSTHVIVTIAVTKRNAFKSKNLKIIQH